MLRARTARPYTSPAAEQTTATQPSNDQEVIADQVVGTTVITTAFIGLLAYGMYLLLPTDNNSAKHIDNFALKREIADLRVEVANLKDEMRDRHVELVLERVHDERVAAAPCT